KPARQADGSTTTQAAGPAKAEPDTPVPSHTAAPADARAPMSTEDALHQRSSPLVRKIAKEHNVDISQIHGTGIAGRVTKDDILAYISGASAQAGRQGEPMAQGGTARIEEPRHVASAPPAAPRGRPVPGTTAPMS